MSFFLNYEYLYINISCMTCWNFNVHDKLALAIARMMKIIRCARGEFLYERKFEAY